MPAGLPVVLALFAQAATAVPAEPPQPAYGPAKPAPAKLAPPPTAAGRECTPQSTDTKSNEIVVCAVKPEGYRLPPDIVEARRLKKQGDRGRPHNPHETYADHSCATIGPMGCRGVPTIDFIAVAAVAAKISDRLAKGQEIGSIFETTPHPSEYQLYLEAKRRREAKEAETAAQAKVATEQSEKPEQAIEDGVPKPTKPASAAPGN
jgi:hypothetical protein